MPITQKHVDKLKATYKKQYGKELPNADAWAMAHRLISLFQILTTSGTKSSKDSGSNPAGVGTHFVDKDN